jgi:hypothetical protein
MRAPLLPTLLLAFLASGGCDKMSTSSHPAANDGSPGVTQPQGPSSGPGGTTPGGMMGNADMAGMCPMSVAGTTVQAADAPHGMTMTFTTTGDVSALQQRVHKMADHMSVHSGGGMHGMMGGLEGGSTLGRMMPAMHAKAEDIDRGARVEVTPDDPAKLGEMREVMHKHAQQMNQEHGCAMMEVHP